MSFKERDTQFTVKKAKAPELFRGRPLNKSYQDVSTPQRPRLRTKSCLVRVCMFSNLLAFVGLLAHCVGIREISHDC